MVNYTLLLGPLWTAHALEEIRRVRLEVLLGPPPGSPSHNTAGLLDEGSPQWAPRDPSGAEESALMSGRYLREFVRGMLNDKTHIELPDIDQVLAEFHPVRWAEVLRVLADLIDEKSLSE